MRCWSILQIDPTADTRAIKKAYAVLLKQNRPDADPAAFQSLHGAYQQALRWAENQDSENSQPEREGIYTATESGHISCHSSNEERPLPADSPDAPGNEEMLIDPDADPLTEDEHWQDFLDQQWDLLVQQIETLLEQPDHFNDWHQWQFLFCSEALQDIEFKAAFSLRFLQRLIKAFQEQQQSGKSGLLPATVQQLNNLFWWSERRHHFEDYFEPELFDDFIQWWQPDGGVQSACTAHSFIPPYATGLRRLQAFLLDTIILFWLGRLTGLALQAESNLEPGALTVAFLYPLLSPIFEISPLRGTPGKYYCGIQVCDNAGHPIRFWRALLRAAGCVASLRFIYVTFIINLLIWDGRLLHDRLSGTRVLKRS